MMGAFFLRPPQNRDVGRGRYGRVSVTHSPPHGETVGIACFRNHRPESAPLRGPQKNVTSRTQETAMRRRYPQ
jgi:hypothetical protein